MRRLEASAYQALASSVFASTADEPSRLLSGTRIEQVCASAIPGAPSKGDLDICVNVPAVDHLATVGCLKAAGYAIKAHTLRTPELCMRLSPRTDLDVALQVVAADSEFEFFMHVRDEPRSDGQLVEQYNQIKRDFATLDAQQYRDVKAKFIEAVLRSE
jgi:GrpB-like predicted nucleotidyltransferase (UPF0157 family)